jgi:hypothetical protein
MSEAMSQWEQDHLEAIGGAKEIKVSSPHEDGSMDEAVTIWVVRVGDELFVRSVRGEHGAWYQRAEDKHLGRIEVDGAPVDVEFEDVGEEKADEIDAAYREKYSDDSESVESITSPDSRATTIRLIPRGAS